MDLMPMNEESFLPPREKGPQEGRRQNPNSGYKYSNPHSENQTMKPLPQVTLEEVTKALHNRTVGKPSLQQKRK